MKKLILFCLVFLCLQPVFGEKPKVAVMLEDRTGKLLKNENFIKDEEFQMGSMFAKRVKGKFSTVTLDQAQKKVILNMQKESQSMEKNKNGLIDFGNQTSAQYLFYAVITGFGNNEYSVSARLINLKNGEYFASDPVDFEGGAKVHRNLREALKKVMDDLIGQSDLVATDGSNSKIGDSEDEQFCRMARNDSDVNGWRIYKEKFPNGKCAEEAEKALDKKGCEIANSKNTPQAWQKYLEKHPKGSCVDKANQILFKAKYEKAKELDRLKRWSKRSSNKMTWNAAKQYCENLTEGGYSDWRLPTIDELRTLIKNCPKTEPGGQCKVSEKNNCLSWKQCGNGRLEGSCSCEKKNNNGGYYSKLGDPEGVLLWSSSVLSDSSSSRWIVYFYNGYVDSYDIDNDIYVRCVR